MPGPKNYTVHFTRTSPFGIKTDFILMVAKTPEECIERFNKRSDRQKLGPVVRITDPDGNIVWPIS